MSHRDKVPHGQAARHDITTELVERFHHCLASLDSDELSNMVTNAILVILD